MKILISTWTHTMDCKSAVVKYLDGTTANYENDFVFINADSVQSVVITKEAAHD